MSKAERTKQYIVACTAPIFNEKGYFGTSMIEMTKATGLTKGSIYGNFENKDEVALAAFDYNFDRVTTYLKDKILAKENAIERLLVYPQVYSKFLTTPLFKQGCPILNTSTEADDTHPMLKQKAANAIAFWKLSIENQLNRGIERGEIKSETDVNSLAVILISIIEGAVMEAKVSGKSNNLNTAMNYLSKIISDLKV